MDEEDDYASDNETMQSDEDGNSSARSGSSSPRQRRNSSAAATGDDEGSNLPDKRRSVFSTESRMSGGMPEISIRRRTRTAGVPGVDESNAAGSPSHDAGTIARASRIIAELEQDHGGLEFPLDALRRASGGFGDEADDDDE